MTILTLRACAKINLGLRIVGRRADGYHELVTTFQRLDLADVISLYPLGEGVAYHGTRLTEDPRHNLSVQAAKRFFDRFGISAGIAITLTKRIPTGAGLGGGSSDAASTLRGLAQLHQIDLSDPQLVQIALELGADVPFFLSDLSAASGRGLGELLTPSPGLSQELWIVIFWPGFQLSTAQAYRELDNILTWDESNTNLKARSLLAEEGAGKRHYFNDFESVIFSAHPQLLEARDHLLEAGAVSAGLAGSGSSLFAIFDGEAKARAAASYPRPPWQSFVCRPC